MRVVFLCSNQDIKVGSYRIWIHDLQKTLSEIGVESIVHNPYDQIHIDPNRDTVILSKGDPNLAPTLRKTFPHLKMGVINLDAAVKNLPVDFIIVGSIEEMDSLSSYENVFLYPLIERKFENVVPKIHTHSDTIKICFHGHYPHLSKFNPHLSSAIEEYSKNYNIELRIITGFPEFDWQVGRPNIDNIKMIKWDFDSITDEILDCDIGIVPNITDYSSQIRNITSKDLGLYETDFCFRFKNKSNAGRCFVFHQLGIPIIADLTPSNFHVMGDQKNGYLAMSKDGWLKALYKLSDYSHRNEVSKNAHSTFKHLYDPHEWAKSLISEISGIIKND